MNRYRIKAAGNWLLGHNVAPRAVEVLTRFLETGDYSLLCPYCEADSQCAVCRKVAGLHLWGTDGHHSNTYCKQCYADQTPENREDKCHG